MLVNSYQNILDKYNDQIKALRADEINNPQDAVDDEIEIKALQQQIDKILELQLDSRKNDKATLSPDQI